MDYFSEKLAQYGEEIEVPIRSLLGHRSQASPEVRHVSGQHFHEFREFLLKHPQAFLVDDENETVTLKDFESVKSHTQELHFDINANLDPVTTQTVLDFLAKCIEVKGPILVEQLFPIVSCNLPEEMWSNLFNTPAHLTSFLRLFSDSFHIQSNLVTLLQHPRVSTKHVNAQNNKNKAKSSKSPPLIKNEDKKPEQPPKSVEDEPKLSSIEKLQLSPKGSISDRLKQPKMLQKMNELQAKAKSPEPADLRISSPTNSDPDVEKVSSVHFRLGRYSKTNDNNPQEFESQQDKVTARNANNNQTLKQRINNLVLKTLQENTGKDMHNMHQNLQNQDAWKVKIFQNTRVVCSKRECQMVVNEVLRIVQPDADSGAAEAWPFTSEKQVVGIDLEGINLGVRGKITLIQMAKQSGLSYIFDLISCPAMITTLKTLLESPRVIKVSQVCAWH